MEVSSPASELNLPDGVEEADLYDGPKPGAPAQVVQHPSAAAARAAALVAPIPQPPPAPVPDVSYNTSRKDYPAVITLALDVLAARLLGLIALVTACLIWAGVVWDPNIWRIVAAGTFSITVFLPMVAIYWKAGMTGEGG